MNIICFSNIDWGFIKQRHQHLMSAFAEMLEVENIIFVETLGTRSLMLNKEDLRRGIKKVVSRSKAKQHTDDEISEKIKILSPKFLPLFNDAAYEINSVLLKYQINKITREHNIKLEDTIAWVMLPHPSIYRLLKKMKFNKIIFDCIDDIKSIPNTKEIIINTEENLIKESDIVFTTSNALNRKCIQLNENTYMLKNAVSKEFLNEKNRVNADKKKKVVGYVGTIYEWFDLAIIEQLAKCNTDIDIILAGPVRIDVSTLMEYNNVKLLGKVSYEEVEKLIESFDVCLIPFIVNDLILNTNPVKLYEYFSKGKPVVTANIPEIREFENLLYAYDNSEEFLEAVRKALDEKDVNLFSKRKDVASRNTWESRTENALEIIKIKNNK